MGKRRRENSVAPKTAYEPSLARFSSLQAILCCPRTKTDLRLVPLEDLLSCLPEDERQRLPDETIGAFISDADRRAYPLTETIAYFLEHTSLRISSRFSETGSTSELQISVDDITESVRDWYDRFGWKKYAERL